MYRLQTTIEAFVDVKTTDAYLLRVFVLGFTARAPNQLKKCSYAQGSQVRNIRRRMVEIVTTQISSSNLKEVVEKLLVDAFRCYHGNNVVMCWSCFIGFLAQLARRLRRDVSPSFHLKMSALERLKYSENRNLIVSLEQCIAASCNVVLTSFVVGC